MPGPLRVEYGLGDGAGIDFECRCAVDRDSRDADVDREVGEGRKYAAFHHGAASDLHAGEATQIEIAVKSEFERGTADLELEVAADGECPRDGQVTMKGHHEI